MQTIFPYSGCPAKSISFERHYATDQSNESSFVTDDFAESRCFLPHADMREH